MFNMAKKLKELNRNKEKIKNDVKRYESYNKTLITVVYLISIVYLLKTVAVNVFPHL